MKVSKLWLDKFFDGALPAGRQALPEAAVLADALTFHAFEIDGVEQFEGHQMSVKDEVLDVKVTPNRGHDCLSHRGIAKELSAILKLPIVSDPLSAKSDLSPKTGDVEVTVDYLLCKRYIAGYIRGIEVGPSPEWLKARLEAIGQRSINNVVDAANFVMFNTGQPLHTFDASKLKTENGKFKIEVQEQNGTLVIVDGNAHKVLGVAGIKGGPESLITPDTKDIIIESANFDGVSVRRTAQALKLRTDASTRFEQVLSPELAAYGMQSAVELIQKLAGGELIGYTDVYPEPQKPVHASVTVDKVNRVLGTSLTGADVADAFARLGLPYKEQAGVFEVSVPFERLDITIAEDLIEEVARIVGYDKIPSTPLPAFDKQPEINKNFAAAERAREELAQKGYSEVYTSVFADQGERAVANKVGGDRPYLRSSLLPGLTEALVKNKPNKDLLRLKEIKLFEIGIVWKDGKEAMMLGTVTEKEKASEKILEPAVATQYDNLPLSAAVRFENFSKYPYIVRDVAVWVPNGTEPVEVLKKIKQEAGELAQKVTLFDTFTKEGRTSLAFRIIFQSFGKTLTEAEANTVMEKVSSALKAQGFEIR